jgi:hypothetical protein
MNELHPLWMKKDDDGKLHTMDENICSCMTCIHDYVDNDGEMSFVKVHEFFTTYKCGTTYVVSKTKS